MYRITDIEDAILNTLQADHTLSSYVRVFSPVPSLNLDDLKTAFVQYPAIGVVSPRGTYDYSISNVQTDTSLFSVLGINRNLRSAAAAMRGGTNAEKGLWDMMDDCRRVLLAGLSGVSVIDCLPRRRLLIYAGKDLAIASLEVEIKWRNL